MQKINLIQFLPYFPPHKGGLETVAEELGYFYTKAGYGEVINIIFDVGQETPPAFSKLPPQLRGIEGEEYIKNKLGKIIGYKQKGYTVYLLPSFDIISNFPVPKIWKREFWEVLKKVTPPAFSKLPPQLRGIEGDFIIQTHTRFFLSSLIGGLFAKKHKLKWIHIEHGSDYVKLGSKVKSKISYIYDRLIGKRIFKKSDEIVTISEGVKKFIQKEFVDREVEVIYRGINFIPKEKQENNGLIKIGFVGRLVKLKGVDLLILAFKNLEKKYPNIVLEIVGDGEAKEHLKSIKNERINFLGMKNREEVACFLSTCDILINPSFQEGLPTTVLEGLLSGCVVVASDVGGTSEISDLDDLILVNSGDLESLEKGLEKAILNYRDLRGKSGKLVREKFDWRENIEQYYNLYKTL